MLNYNEIQNLFGKPLSKVPTQRTPQQIKIWHVAAVGLITYFIYKGIIKTIQENSIRIGIEED